MAEDRADLEIVVGSKVDEGSAEQTGKDIVKTVKKGIGNNGYIKLPVEITKFKYPKRDEKAISGPRTIDYSGLQKAQDELLSSWKKLSKKGFSSDDDTVFNSLKSYREYEKAVKRQYPGTEDLKDPQVMKIRSTIGNQLTKYFTRLAPAHFGNGKQGSFMRLDKNEEFEKYAKTAIRRYRAAQEAGIDLSKSELSKEDRSTIIATEEKLLKQAYIDKTMAQRKYEKEHAQEIMEAEQKELQKIMKERAETAEKAIPIPKSDKPLDDMAFKTTKVEDLTSPRDYTPTTEDKKENKRFLNAIENSAPARRMNTPNNELNLGTRQQVWDPTYLTKDFIQKMERGGTYVDTNALLRQTMQALPEEIKNSIKSLVVKIDKDKALKAFTTFNSSEKKQWSDIANQTGMSQLLLTNVAKVQGALMSGKPGVSSEDLKNAIIVAVNDALQNGKSAIAAENYKSAISSITNMLMNRYNNMKEQIGSTDGSEYGVGVNYEGVMKTLKEVFKDFEDTAEELLKRAIKEFPEFYGANSSSKTGKKETTTTFNQVFNEKLNALMTEISNQIKAGTKITETQLSYDKIEHVREATADSNEKAISKENKDVNRDIAKATKADLITGFNTDTNANKLIDVCERIRRAIELPSDSKQLYKALPDAIRLGLPKPDGRRKKISDGLTPEPSVKKSLSMIPQADITKALAIIPGEFAKTLKESIHPSVRDKQLKIGNIQGTTYIDNEQMLRAMAAKSNARKAQKKTQINAGDKIPDVITPGEPLYSNQVQKSKIYASPLKTSIWDKLETAIEDVTGATSKYKDVLNATAEEQDLMAATRIRNFGINNGRNPNDTGDIASIKRALELFRTNKSSIEQNPELMQKIKLTPGVEVNTTEVTRKLNEKLSGKQMRNAQMGGSIPRQILGGLTGFIGMPSLEKSRAQADGLNQILGNINKALESVLINIQMKETELSGMEKSGQARFTKEGYITADSSSAAKKTLADLEEEKLVLASILADMSTIDEIVDETGGKFSKLVKQLSFTSPVLRENNSIIRNIKSGLDKNGKALKFQTRTAEILNYTFQLMSRSIGQMLKNWLVQLNPITQIKKLFQDFMSYDIKWQRTMNVIKYNLRDIVRPFMEWIAQKLVDIIGFIDIISMKIQQAFGYTPVSLFDQKNADEFKKTYEEINSISAGFDELHDIGTSSENDPNNLLGEIYTPQLSQEWIDLANEIGDLFAGIITGDLGFSEVMLKILKIAWDGLKILGGYVWDFMKNTVWPAIKDNWLEILAWVLGAFIAWKGLKTIGTLLVGAFTGGLKGIVNWISQTLFGKTLFSSATTAGATAGSLFSKALYTSASGTVVTLGKFLGGTALAATGTIGALTLSKSAGENWQDLSTGMKAVSVAGTGLLSGMAGLGAVMLGASGPAGWAIAGTVALASLTLGMAQTQDGIASLEEETEKLAETQANAQTANENYQLSLDNLATTTSNLEQLEKQTGLTGKELEEQVKSGALTVDTMTSAQLQVYTAYLKNEEMIKQLKEATEQKTEADKQNVLQSLRVEAANAIEADSYSNLRDKVVQAWQDGSISAQEAGDILSRTLANADEETQRTFGESIPEEIRSAFNPDQYESGWRKFGESFKSAMKSIADWFTDKWNSIKSWWSGLWSKDSLPDGSGGSFSTGNGSGAGGGGAGGRSLLIGSFAVGTNYVPNDGLAYLHQGEAVIPKKYNQPYQPTGMSPQEQAYMQQMMNTMRSLDNTMKQGISVNGQFVQRGSDLVAVVNKTKSQTGADLLSNVSYAR